VKRMELFPAAPVPPSEVAAMFRMALKVLVGLALSASLTTLLYYLGVGRAPAGGGSDATAALLALNGR